MKRLHFIFDTFLITSRLYAQQKPNTIFLLADGTDYGDGSALNHRIAKVSIPNIDKLVSQWIAFRDAHTPTCLCTSTRYAILNV